MLFIFITYQFLYLIWSIPNSNYNYYYNVGVPAWTRPSKNIFNYIYCYCIITYISAILYVNIFIRPLYNKTALCMNGTFNKNTISLHRINYNYGVSSEITYIPSPLMASKSTRWSPYCRIYNFSCHSTKTRGLRSPTSNIFYYKIILS